MHELVGHPGASSGSAPTTRLRGRSFGHPTPPLGCRHHSSGQLQTRCSRDSMDNLQTGSLGSQSDNRRSRTRRPRRRRSRAGHPNPSRPHRTSMTHSRSSRLPPRDSRSSSGGQARRHRRSTCCCKCPDNRLWDSPWDNPMPQLVTPCPRSALRSVWQISRDSGRRRDNYQRQSG